MKRPALGLFLPLASLGPITLLFVFLESRIEVAWNAVSSKADGAVGLDR